MISIALCTYNGEKYIGQQLQSLITQTYQPDEIVVCDDQSRDNTVGIVKQILENWSGKYQIIINKKNLGYKKNFQKAISLCKGKLIFLSDQDDVWDKNKIAEILTIFNCYPEIIMVFHDAEIVDEKLQPISPSLWHDMKFNYKEFKNKNYFRFTRGNVIQGAACAFRRNLFELAQPFPLEAIHDEWLALNAISNGGIYPINKRFLKYRQTDQNEIGAISENFSEKIYKWIRSTKKNIKFHYINLKRYASVWNALQDKYGESLVLGDQNAVTFSKFLNKRENAISAKKINKLPNFKEYVVVYGSEKWGSWIKLKDILAVIML